jgi:branched-chain amino acid transport system substrate-binding protein
MMHPEPTGHGCRSSSSDCVALRALADGRVAAVDTRAGLELVRRLDPLARYAVAFAGSHLRQTRFVWVEDARSWHAVCLTLERRPDGDSGTASALVEIEPSPPPYGLTVRELEVLTLICGGLSNPEIAAHLGMSARTVSTHVAHIIAKLGQASRAGAAALAIDQGLLRVPVPGSGRALGVLGVGLLDQIASGLVPTVVRTADPGWQHVLRPRLRPIQLGTLIDAAGSADAEQVRNGSAMAVAEINSRGGVAGRLIEQVLVEVDIDDPPSFGAGLRCLAGKDVDAIVGGYTFYLDPDAYASARHHGCPIVTAMTSEEQAGWVRDDPASFGRVFQVGPTEVNYGTGTVAFLEQLRASGRWTPDRRRIVPVETPVDAGQPFGPLAREHAERAGWSVEAPIPVPLRNVDWEPVMARIAAADPGVVVLTHFVPGEAAAFQRAFVRSGVRALVYMVYAPALPAFLRESCGDAEGVVWSTVTGTYADALGEAFQRRYAARFGQPPGRSLAGSTFDQVHILALAWARVGDAHRFAEVAAELRRISYRGVNGSYVLGTPDQTGRSYPLETRDPSLGQAHLVFQVQRGVHRVLHPAPYAQARFRLPPWLAREPAAVVASGTR